MIACIIGALAVALGAFGAHALADQLDARGARLWRTANLYHFWHALLLLIYALAGAWTGDRCWFRAAIALITGITLFSGSLYVLALGGPGWIGWLTPVGGLALISGWLLVLGGLRKT